MFTSHLPHRTDALRSARRQRQVVTGLRAVARRSAPSAAPARFGVLLIDRAAAVRPQLLEVAALVAGTAQPAPHCIDRLHALLTDGCASPLFNPRVPAAALSAELDEARAALRPAAERAAVAAL